MAREPTDAACNTIHASPEQLDPASGGQHDEDEGDVVSGNVNNQDSSAWRWPDYGSVQISAGPWWGGVVMLMWADGHAYISVGGTLGKPLADLAIAGIPVAGDISGGWVWQSTRPSPEQLRRFLTG